MKQKQFLDKLQAQAKLQSQIAQSSVMPHFLDRVNSLIGNYPWQFLLAVSGLSAFLLSLSQVAKL
jgi:hypothetical protein